MPVQTAPNDRVLTINKSLFTQQGLQGKDVQDSMASVQNNDELSLIHNHVRVV
ncbi:MAG: hypothetical protein QG632_307 [Candidatus Dependentiae bacterium]|nr:hypothetical protein [Candidatus Dependentiae bacterium]